MGYGHLCEWAFRLGLRCPNKLVLAILGYFIDGEVHAKAALFDSDGALADVLRPLN